MSDWLIIMITFVFCTVVGVIGRQLMAKDIFPVGWLALITHWLTNKSIHWHPPFGLVAQLSHFAWGGLGVYFLTDTLHAHWLLAAVVVTLLAAVKEFFIDIKVIEGSSYLSSGWDFTWYMAGILLFTHFVRHPL